MDIHEVLNKVKETFGIFGNELVIRTSTSDKDLNTCNGVATKDTETNTCVEDVAANRTVYRNTNRCEFTHANCRCKYEFFSGKLRVDFPIEKIIGYLFKDINKSKMMKGIGYYAKDALKLYDYIYKVIENAYNDGEYILGALNQHGQHAQINFTIKGQNDHTGELFRCHAGCVFWLNGVIRVVTPLIEDGVIR